MGVLFKFQEVRIIVVSPGNTFVVLLVPEVCALLWGFLSRRDRVRRIGNTFVTSGMHLSHREHVCHPAHSGGSCPPVGVLVASGTHSSCRLSSRSFQRFMPSNGGSLQVLGGPSCHCRGMCSSRRSSSHLFHRFLPSCGGSL